MRVLGMWFSVLAFIGAGFYLEGGNFKVAMQTTPALMVFGPCLAFALFCYGTGITKFFGRVFNAELTDTDEEFVQRFCSLGFVCGGLGTVLGFVHVLSNLGSPEVVATGVAMAFVSLLYGAVPSLMFIPLNRVATKKAAGGKKGRSFLYKAAGFAFFVATFLPALTFGVYYSLTRGMIA